MSDMGFNFLLETSVYIQSLPIWEDDWEHPETYSNPRRSRLTEASLSRSVSSSSRPDVLPLNTENP